MIAITKGKRISLDELGGLLTAMCFLYVLATVSLKTPILAASIISLLFFALPCLNSTLIRGGRILKRYFPTLELPGKFRLFLLKCLAAYSVIMLGFITLLVLFLALTRLHLGETYGDATVLLGVLGGVLVCSYGGPSLYRLSARLCVPFTYENEWDKQMPSTEAVRRIMFLLTILLNVANTFVAYRIEPYPWYVKALSDMSLQILVIFGAIDVYITSFWHGDIEPIRKPVRLSVERVKSFVRKPATADSRQDNPVQGSND